jgi:hypothetical protein
MAVSQNQAGQAESAVQDKNFVHVSLIIIFGILATTLAQPQVLGKIPLQHILKASLHVSKAENAKFFLVCGLFWYLKPVAGILTDAFPLFGTRRRWYLLSCSILAAISWIILGQPSVAQSYGSLLIAAIIVNLFMVMMSTVVGAYMVQIGQETGGTGKLSSLRIGVQQFCTLVQGPLGGFLASGVFMKAAGVNSFFVLTVFPVAWLFLREKRVTVSSSEALGAAGEKLVTIFTSASMWIPLLFILLYYFAPGLGTVLYYRQNDVLKLDQQHIGNLGFYSGACGIIAALAYTVAVRFLNFRWILAMAVGLAAVSTMAYLFYTDYTKAILIDGQNGFFGAFAEVALMDLAVRATPKGCEGLGFALIMSFRNVALFGADYVGSLLSDNNKWPFEWLVYLNAGTTALVLIILPLIPTTLMVIRNNPKAETREALEVSEA